MSSETRDPNQQDLPWNDAPADSDAPGGAIEPAPAEVHGDDEYGTVIDASVPRHHDPYEHDTLDERLAEELPDRTLSGANPGTRVIASDASGPDTEGSLADIEGPDEGAGDISAEESAVHVRDEV